MESDGISNIYIDHLMQQISLSFRGTFSLESIPTFEEETFSLIVNLSKVDEKRSHFIALFVLENKIWYFDSFGTLQINTIIEKYLKKYRKTILYTKTLIQHPLSSHCGFFCISFILCIENKVPSKIFFKMFHKDKLYINDHICIEIINFFIKHMYLRK